MPEGPEVKLLTETIANEISSKYITEIKVISGKYLKKQLKI